MTIRSISLTILVACPMLLASCSSAPSPEKRRHIHQIHGHQRVDPYHWLKDPERKDKQVLAHLNAENRHTDSYMSSTRSLQEALYSEILGRVKETDFKVPYRYKGFYYYSRTEKGKNYPIYCRKRGSLKAPEQIILDMNEVAKGKTNVSLGSLKVSPDQNILAYTIDEKGEEIYTLLFKDIESGKLYIDRVANVTPDFEWAEDSRTLFFTRMNKAFRHNQVFSYRLAGSGEKLVFEDKDPLFDVWVSKTQDKKYLLMGSGSFTSDEVYYLKSDKPIGQWRVIQKRQAKLEYSIEHHNGNFYILNNKDAINFKISRAPVRTPELAMWADYIKHDPQALITQMHIQSRRIIYKERRAGLSKVRYVNFTNRARYEVHFNEPVYEVSLGKNPEYHAQHLRLKFESPITPKIVYDFDFTRREFYTQKKKEVPNYQSNRYQTKRVMVTARDGQTIPVTLLFKKGFQQNGQAPALLYGYGSYGYTISPRFQSSIFSLVDRGFLYAIAHIRGSQAKGRSWYEDGKLLRKKNTFNDFIDVARGLIGGKYTSSDRLAIRGGSAGGLLMGAVVNQRPELFKAVVAQVPFVDVLSTILDPKLRFSTQEYQQWGNPNQSEAYNYILTYSPYENVERKRYPAILAVAGLHDSRVNYWEPAKWIAKLRDYSTSSNPLLLRTQMEAGHGGSNARYKKYREEAEIQAFLLKTLGIAGT